MKKIISLLLALVLGFSLVACSKTTTVKITTNGTTDATTTTGNVVDPVTGVWNPSNILSRKVEKDDLLIGTWVSFADTGKKLSALDQIERYYYTGLNFMPFACTIPKAGMLTEEEELYIQRDLTSALWWGKIDDVMKEYNMVYYFSTLSGIGNDHESVIRRESMMCDEALNDARAIIPELDNCIGVHVVDEPGAAAFPECAKWAKRYAAIRDENDELMGLDALVNHVPVIDFNNWCELSGSTVGVLSHDSYPFSQSGTGQGFISSMNVMRQLANKYGLKQSMFPQSCAWSGTRMPNFEEIKWHFNVNLALGVTQFMYFNYIMYPNEGCYDAIYAIDGTVLHPETDVLLTEYHKELRSLDANVRLNDYDVTSVYYTKNAANGIDKLPANWIISNEDMSQYDLMLSLFEKADKNSDDKTRYLNILNNSFTNELDSVDFIVGDNYDDVKFEKYNYQTGEFEPVTLINGVFSLSFDKAESVFLKIVE